MEVQEEFGDQIRFIGVPSLSSDIDGMIEFTEDTGSDIIAQVPDLDGEIWSQFGVREQRTYVYINDDGTWETSGYGSLRDDVIDLIGR